MDITTTSLSGHRKIIIPQGILDAAKNNVIYVPKELSNSLTPLVVAQTRQGLIARMLPEFNDELSGGNQSHFQELMAGPMTCPSESQPAKQGGQKAGDTTFSRAANRTFPTDVTQPRVGPMAASTPKAPGPMSGVGYSSGDSSGPGPRLLHASSAATRKVQNQPAEGKTFRLNAQQGLDKNALQRMTARPRSSSSERPCDAECADQTYSK